MKTEVFKQKIYGPYADCWKVLKLLQFAGEGGFTQEQVNEYWEAVEKFQNDNQGNEFAEFMRKNVLLHADNIIVRMNERGANENQTTKQK